MAQARVEMEATILPNGKVLVDGGSAKDEDASTASMKAEIYDPVDQLVLVCRIKRVSQALPQRAVASAGWHGRPHRR